MKVITLTTEYMESHIYFITEGSSAIIIDPSDTGLLEKTIYAEHIEPELAILTHEHCDHSCGCRYISERYGCKVLASETCSKALGNPKKNFSYYYPAYISVQSSLPEDQQKMIDPFEAQADIVFGGDTELEWRGHSIALHETPGHSPGSICIIVDDKIMFSGDTLMEGEETNTRFIGGNKSDLLNHTIPWLKSLPGDFKVYPGHGPEFVLGERLNTI